VTGSAAWAAETEGVAGAKDTAATPMTETTWTEHDAPTESGDPLGQVFSLHYNEFIHENNFPFTILRRQSFITFL
jgi:hypothetical protein